VLAVGALLVFAGAAAADPVGPTDYRSEIVELDPPVPGVEVGIVGGDSFVELRADPGVEVVVVGYRGEPYLRFEVDGTVRRNERSPSRWQNDDRYAAVELPPAADADGDPEWVDVAGDGIYAWHDHRAHWMNPTRPPGAEPGDTILEAVIPLAVDGIDVEVHVRSTLLAGPSPLAPILGGLAGLGLGLPALLGGRRAGETDRRRSLWPLAPALVGWAAAATVIAAIGARGFPPEAAPGPALWAVPAVAGLVVLVGMVIERRGLLSPPLRALIGPAVLALAGVELLLWVWLRREALVRALIPGDAPGWLDRAVIAGAGTLGLVALGGAVQLLRERRPALRPRR
jgi:hypothetical protein